MLTRKLFYASINFNFDLLQGICKRKTDTSRYMMDVNEDTFLRRLNFSHQQKLSRILDINGVWEILAARIPTKPDLLFQPNVEWEPRY